MTQATEPLATVVEDAHDPRMLQARYDSHFTSKPLARRSHTDVLRPDDLQGHDSAKRRLLGAEDDTHSASAESIQNAELADLFRELQIVSGDAIFLVAVSSLNVP